MWYKFFDAVQISENQKSLVDNKYASNLCKNRKQTFQRFTIDVSKHVEFSIKWDICLTISMRYLKKIQIFVYTTVDYKIIIK